MTPKSWRFLSRRLRLVAATAVLVLGAKVAAAALAPEPVASAPGAARITLPD